MRLHLLSYFLLLLGMSCLHAQEIEYKKDYKVYKSDELLYGVLTLDEVNISAKAPSARELKRGKRRLKKFNRLRWNVHKVYPYAVAVGDLLVEVQKDLDALPSKKEKREYVKSKESALFGEYEDDIRKMSRSQGKILIKLIDRETGSSTFALIKDVKSGAKAVFWQSIGLIFGLNLKAEYDEESEAMLEAIIDELENGGYNIVYKQYDYKLN